MLLISAPEYSGPGFFCFSVGQIYSQNFPVAILIYPENNKYPLANYFILFSYFLVASINDKVRIVLFQGTISPECDFLVQLLRKIRYQGFGKVYSTEFLSNTGNFASRNSLNVHLH